MKLPPGFVRLRAEPAATGSPLTADTIGIVSVASWAARPPGQRALASRLVRHRQSAVFGFPGGTATPGNFACRSRIWRRLDQGSSLLRPYLYRSRNLVERFFNRIKQCRRIATLYDKLAVNYLAFVKPASIRLWLRAYESTP